MKHIIKRHTISIKHAVDGVLWAIKSQPNFRLHLILASVALMFGLYLQLGYLDWVVIIATIIGGLVIEMLNTAIEATTDAIDLNLRPDIKIAKDVAAGAMLIYALGATVVAYIVFSQYFVFFYS